MSEWPANSDTDWNTKMLAYLAIEHTTDGHHKYPVNGTPTNVLTKYLTGSLDAAASTAIAHGVTSGKTKILSVTFAAHEDVTDAVFAGDFAKGATAASAWQYIWDDTNITVTGVGANVQGNAYYIRIDYIL